jgi:hypothetical protein
MSNPDGNRGEFYEDVLGLNHVLRHIFACHKYVYLTNRITAGGVMTPLFCFKQNRTVPDISDKKLFVFGNHRWFEAIDSLF